MEEYGFFSPRHPLNQHEQLAVAYIDPRLHGPRIIYNYDIASADSAELFQHIECGAVFLTRDLLAWRNVIDAVEHKEMTCPCCHKESIIDQLKVMGFVESDEEIIPTDRYELILQAIRGTQFQFPTLALKNMLLLPEFRCFVYKQYGKNFSLLEYAIMKGDEKALLLLIEYGARPASLSLLMETPLHVAVRWKKPWAVRVLLEHGADPDASHFYKETALQMCIRLFTLAVDSDERNIYLEISRVFTSTSAVFDDHRDAFEKETDASGVNQLHKAAMALDHDEVYALLAAGVDPNLTDNQGFTPLMFMAARNTCFDDGVSPAFVNIARLLCARTRLTSPVFVMALLNLKTRLCVELFRAGFQKGGADFAGDCFNTLLPKLYDANFLVLKLFFQCCRAVLVTQNDLSVLHIAVGLLPENEKMRAFISRLIYFRAFCADHTDDLRDPLDPACRDITYLVSEYDVNAVDARGETALFTAIRSDKLEFVKQLEKDGADFTVRNNAGEFAISIAHQNNSPEMIEFVREKSRDAIEEGPHDDNERELEEILQGEESSMEESSSTEDEASSMEESSEENSSEIESPRFRRGM